MTWPMTPPLQWRDLRGVRVRCAPVGSGGGMTVMAMKRTVPCRSPSATWRLRDCRHSPPARDINNNGRPARARRFARLLRACVRGARPCAAEKLRVTYKLQVTGHRLQVTGYR